ncbi:histidinol-phosphate transaminase [Enterorhabdus sp. P55]|uniref:histidinol-phosphate transaminase n=1 Tax=Enterorhabdus sp. P55 TaxID=2304571 RepID=UPI00136B13B0|nr:histidinol-phosphate transaminase [Enterorhabdus sp. P55]NBI31618.1 histidinol-phosphate transaminase [Enterorhabdus sp. P55]
MRRVRPAAPQLAGLEPYDPKYLPAEAFLSANENPCDVEAALRAEIVREIRRTALNRYPDPLANDLRDLIAEANGLDRDQVLVGNGGDELLFDLALAWGGPGRTFLNLPPTFSVYATNAQLTNTRIVEVARRADFSLDEEAVLARVAAGDIDYVIVTSPNNPTGERAPEDFVLRLLDATDALVVVDEAYFEFSRRTLRPYLESHENLLILRTFSKAFSLAGVRVGYVLGHAHVIRELVKVRQPYSVDALSQAAARVVFANRATFEPGIAAIIEERERLMRGLLTLPGVTPFPSDANYILFRMEGADAAWAFLYERGVLVRDFSHAPLLEGCLRVTVGTPEQNDGFLAALRDFIMGRCEAR